MQAYQRSVNLVRTNTTLRSLRLKTRHAAGTTFKHTCRTERQDKQWTGTNAALATKMTSQRVYFRAEGSKTRTQSPVAA